MTSINDHDKLLEAIIKENSRNMTLLELKIQSHLANHYFFKALAKLEKNKSVFRYTKDGVTYFRDIK